jgi:hypothetical protein
MRYPGQSRPNAVDTLEVTGARDGPSARAC